MSKSIEEIKELIATKIAGQGNQVDSGGALGDILNGILENMALAPSEGEQYIKAIEVTGEVQEVTAAEANKIANSCAVVTTNGEVYPVVPLTNISLLGELQEYVGTQYPQYSGADVDSIFGYITLAGSGDIDTATGYVLYNYDGQFVIIPLNF